MTAPAASANREFLGHPKGLTVLFTTEMWERFSYFGNAALVVLYMVKYLFVPERIDTVIGLHAVKIALAPVFGPLEGQPLASQLFGFYTGFAYFMPIFGGLLADRFLGQRRTVILGAILMAIGHFMMAFEPLLLFALGFLILGIGAFKPNISVQVGALYAPGDPRRDRGYSIFYLGINVGALLAPLICGGLAAAFGWHYGFAAAGVGMLISLGIYLGGQRALPHESVAAAKPARARATPLTRDEWRPVLAIIAVCIPVALFWAAYDQQGNTVLLWAEDYTDRTIDLWFWRGDIPAPSFLALNAAMIFVFTPLIVRLWAWQSQHGREPYTITKMAYACLAVALANLLMATAAAHAGDGKASAWWLTGYFALATIGELYLAPVGLALISKVAPARLLSTTMGFWFATTLPADILGGHLGGYWDSMAKSEFFLMTAAIATVASVLIYAVGRLLKPILAR